MPAQARMTIEAANAKAVRAKTEYAAMNERPHTLELEQ
jgi:hypothetical protein